MGEAFTADARPGEVRGVCRYTRHGDGRPVVILSNPQADPSWWAPPFVSALNGAGYEVICFTHTGTSYAPPDVVGDLARFVEYLDIEPVRLFGWSQGAALAQELALLRPDLVASAALVATYGRQNNIDRLLQSAWAALDHAPAELDPVRQALLLLTSYPPELLGDDTSATPLIAGSQSWAVQPSVDNEARRRSFAFIAAYQERLTELRRVRVPCLVVGFGADADTFVVRAREVAAAIPGALYVELPDAGHLAPVIDPRSVIDPVLRFFLAVDDTQTHIPASAPHAGARHAADVE